MHSKPGQIVLTIVLSLLLAGNPVWACSWAAYANGKANVVARTMDWYSNDNAVVEGHGRNARAKAADTPGAVEYAAKYASLQVRMFAAGIIAEALNEKGLQGSILFLDGSELPEVRPGRGDVNPNSFIAYAISSFATVQEVVDSLDTINFIPSTLAIPGADGEPLAYGPRLWPGHYAFADASGDKAVIEFIKGEVVVYHGKQYDAMTNEPDYDFQLKIESFGYQPNGTISTVDRRMRAKRYLQDMYERGVDATPRALLAMRGLLASVFAGSEEIDRAENEVYPTIWSVLADQNGKTYYLSRVYSWCSEVYDFSMFDYEKPEVVTLEAAGCPYAEIDTEGVI